MITIFKQRKCKSKLLGFILTSIYLWIHNEDHRFTSVWICRHKFSFNRIFILEMNFDKLPVTVSTIQHTPVNPNKKTTHFNLPLHNG